MFTVTGAGASAATRQRWSRQEIGDGRIRSTHSGSLVRFVYSGDWLVEDLMALIYTGFIYGQSETNKVNGIKLQCYGMTDKEVRTKHVLNGNSSEILVVQS
jgi:hypothetical protein